MMPREEPDLFHVVEARSAIIPAEETEKETHSGFVRKAQKADRILKPSDNEIEESGDLSKPDEDTGKNEEGEDLFEIPMDSAVCFDQDIGNFRKPERRNFHIEGWLLTRHNFARKKAYENENQRHDPNPDPETCGIPFEQSEDDAKLSRAWNGQG